MRTGIDIIEIKRVEKSISNNHFIERVYSPEEIAVCESRKNRAESYAGRFCVKEAFAKALGTGVRGFELNEVSTLTDSLGCPYISLKGKALKLAENYKFSVSITHSKEYAAAIVIMYK